MAGEVTCAECYCAVGFDGPMRGVLLLPCQHMLHASCEAFLKKRSVLLEPLAGRRSSELGSQILCSACRGRVERCIPLFLSQADAPASGSGSVGTHATPHYGPSHGVTTGDEDEANSDGDDDDDHHDVEGSAPMISSSLEKPDVARHGELPKAHRSQKRYLYQLRRLYEEQKEVRILTHACAEMYQRKEELLREIKQLSKLLPQVAPAASSALAATSTEVLSNSNQFCVDTMSVTELEMYLSHTAPLIDQTEHDIRQLQQTVNRKKKKLAELRRRLATLPSRKSVGAEAAGARVTPGNLDFSSDRPQPGPGDESAPRHSFRLENGCTPLVMALRAKESECKSRAYGSEAVAQDLGPDHRKRPRSLEEMGDGVTLRRPETGDGTLPCVDRRDIRGIDRETVSGCREAGSEAQSVGDTILDSSNTSRWRRRRPQVVIDVDATLGPELLSREQRTSGPRSSSGRGTPTTMDVDVVVDVEEREGQAHSPIEILSSSGSDAEGVSASALIDDRSVNSDSDLGVPSQRRTASQDGQVHTAVAFREHVRLHEGMSADGGDLSRSEAAACGHEEEGDAHPLRPDYSSSEDDYTTSHFSPRLSSLPLMGKSFGRSLRDLPRREDTMWQSTMDHFC